MKKGKMKRFLLLTVVLFLFSTTVCLAGTLGEYSSDKNTVLLLHFNEDSGQTAKDESDCGNNGTLGSGESSPTWTSSGRFGGALSFDGIDDYLSCGNDPSLKLPDEGGYTIEFWFKTQTGGAKWGSIMDYSYASTILYGGNLLRFKLTLNKTPYNFTSPVPIINDTWTHAAFVYSRSGDKVTVKTYSNEILVGSQTKSVSGTMPDGSFVIRPKMGKSLIIDELRISNKARSLNEMVASESLNWGSVIFPKRSGIKSGKIAKWLIKKAPKNEHLVVYWRMDKKSITKDKKGPNDAKIFGAALTPDGLKFDGVNDYIDCGNLEELNFGTGDFTMGFWIKSSEPVKGPLLEKKEGDFVRKIRIAFSEGKPHFDVMHTAKGTMYAYMTGATMLEPDKWYHLMYVADRLKKHPLIYVNGILEDVAVTTQGSWKGDVNSKGNAYLGRQIYRNKASYFNGTIAEFSVWKGIALTADEVKTIYNHDKENFK